MTFKPSAGDVAPVYRTSRCLVTGAGGFIGKAVTQALISAGFIVTGLGRGGASAGDSANVRWINGEWDDPVIQAKACAGQDFVVHLLSSSTPESATREPVGDILANVAPTVRLLEACRDAEVKRFIFASSGGTVYGPVGQTPIPETAFNRPISAYGVSKLTIEKYISLFEHIHGLDGRILRMSNPYGPRQSPFRKQGVVAAFMYSLMQNRTVEMWGDGSVVRDYIYIDDVASAFLAAIRYNGTEQIFNVSSGVGRSIADIYRDIADVLSLNDSRAIINPGRSVDVPVNVLDNSRLINATGWKDHVTWRDGLERTADWMRWFCARDT